MKSKPPAEKSEHLHTSCKECVFAVYKGNTQVECSADRLSILKKNNHIIEAYDEDREFYVVDCFCNYFRPPKWNDGKPDVNKASNENHPRFSIALYADQISEASFRKTVDEISKIDYDKDRIKVIISQLMTAPTQKKKLCTKLFESITRLGFEARIVTLFDGALRDYDTFKQATDGYIVKIKPGEPIPPAMFQQIGYRLNEALDRKVVFESNKTRAISMMVFRTSFHNFKNYNEFDEALTKEAKASNMYIDLDEGA
jgi:hypothetical protein